MFLLMLLGFAGRVAPPGRWARRRCGGPGRCQAARQEGAVPEPQRTDSGSQPTASGREEAGRAGGTIDETRGVRSWLVEGRCPRAVLAFVFI